MFIIVPLLCSGCRVAEVAIAEASPNQPIDPVQLPKMSEMSYSQQYDELYKKPLNIRKIVPKPNKDAQAKEQGASKVFASDVHTVPKRTMFGREWNKTDATYAAFIGGMHLVALAAPFTFSWSMVGLFAATYFISGCLGITLSYHRCAGSPEIFMIIILLLII